MTTPSPISAVKEFEAICDLIPEDAYWGMPLTPDLVRHIRDRSTAPTTGSAPVALPEGWSIRVTPFQVEVRMPSGKGYAGSRDPRTRNGIAGYTLVKLALALHDQITPSPQVAWPFLEPAAATASPAASVLPIQRYTVFETQDGRGPHIVEEPCNTGKWVKYADLAAYSPAVSLDVQNVLCNVTQILDTVKMEWSATNSWSEWDQSVRDSITALLAASMGGDRT